MEQKTLSKNVWMIIAAVGAGVLMISLINKNFRKLSLKIVGIGSSLATEYFAAKYSPRLARVVSGTLPLKGYKGGKAVKKKTFKKAARPRQVM